MALTSPILRFALEVFHHALENYSAATSRHRKMAVLNLAQSIELGIKAALVEANFPIFEKSSRSINTHDALAALATHWKVQRIDYQTRVELLVDERNSIQHKYGNVDDVGLDYHTETAVAVLREILAREFSTSLDDWVHDSIEEALWRGVRFIEQKPKRTPSKDSEITTQGLETSDAPSSAILPERSATLDLIDGFAKYEKALKAIFTSLLPEGDRLSGSTLDLALKALANGEKPDARLIRRVPEIYRLRNQVIHGDAVPKTADVDKALRELDKVLEKLAKIPEETLRLALAASASGIRGTKLNASPAGADDVGPQAAAPESRSQVPDEDDSA